MPRHAGSIPGSSPASPHSPAPLRPEAYEVHGIRVPDPGPLIGPDMKTALEEGWYEIAEVTALREALRPGDRVLDIGACLGVTACAAALVPGVERVVAVEPNPALIPQIRRTCERNGARVEILAGVLTRWTDEGNRWIAFEAEPWASSAILPEGAPRAEVRRFDFDAVMADLKPTVISCDIEGAEYDLLLGAPLTGVRDMVIEMHWGLCGPQKVNDLRRWLVHRGFAETRRDRTTFSYSRAAAQNV